MKYVRDIIPGTITTVPTIDAKCTVIETLAKLSSLDIGALLVTDNGQIVGLVSERDCVRKVELSGKSPHSTMVSEIMSRDILSVTPDASVERCLELFDTHHIRHLPVIRQDGHVVGFVSILDVVKCLVSEKSELIEHLENYVSNTWPF